MSSPWGGIYFGQSVPLPATRLFVALEALVDAEHLRDLDLRIP